MSRYFLGLDSSTQSLTAVLIDRREGRVAHRSSLVFDRDLAGYGTLRGVLEHPDPAIRHAPPLLWAEALDVLLGRMAAEGVPLDQVAAVSGSGQQHGSVYLREPLGPRLESLDPSRPLAEQLEGAFSRATSPVWMDTSTGEDCAHLARVLGGAGRVAELTGSVPVERFTGPQIRAFFRRDPAGFAATGRIHLVSSFMASLMGGVDAPLEPGDGAGMNLMDLASGRWRRECLEATAPDLERRLPSLGPSWTVTGPVAPYWHRRHGLAPSALNVVWSGDNPCSLVGLGILAPGDAAISLGTSDTYFGAMARPRVDPAGGGHVFGHPAGGWMSLICFRNGGLARERMRDALGLTWEGFAAVLEATPPGNGGGLLLPWYEPEIVPRVTRSGIRTRGLGPGAGSSVRGVVEGQMLAMRLNSAWMGEKPGRILATGGGASNDALLQVMADVHQCPVRRMALTDGAALGAALRAAHAWDAHRGAACWESLLEPFTRARARVFTPAPGTAEIYGRMALAYGAFQAECLG